MFFMANLVEQFNSLKLDLGIFDLKSIFIYFKPINKNKVEVCAEKPT